MMKYLTKPHAEGKPHTFWLTVTDAVCYVPELEEADIILHVQSGSRGR